MWEEAGKAGLVLGLTSTAYMFLTQFLTGIELSAVASMIANTGLWIVKFAGCIWLMMYFMKKFAASDVRYGNGTVFRFGMAASLLSAVVYAAASFANAAYFSADVMAEQMNLLMQQMAPTLDSNSLNQLEKIMNKMPQITFCSNLIYCTLYGTVLSFILSRNIPDNNPFAGNTSDEL